MRHGAAWAGRTERVRLALRGAAKRPRPPRPQRLAANPGHLRTLRRSLRSSDIPGIDRAAAWSAVLLGFFGALRGSEYLSPTAHAYDRRRTCQWRHITLHEDRVELQLPASKTDQLYASTLGSLPRLRGAFCPKRALQRFWRLSDLGRREGSRPSHSKYCIGCLPPPIENETNANGYFMKATCKCY